MKKQILKRIKEITSLFSPEAEVFLFGSRARKTATTLSDWDLLVVVNIPTISFDIETQFMDKFYELELETGAVIAPLIYTKNEWYIDRNHTQLFENIKKEGIRL